MKLIRRGRRSMLRLSRQEWFRLGQQVGWNEQPEIAGPSSVTLDRYGKFWAVYVEGELLCVTVYLKGARAVKELIDQLWQRIMDSGTARATA